MQVDESALKKALNEDFEGTKEIIGGQFGIADKVAQKADSAMATSSEDWWIRIFPQEWTGIRKIPFLPSVSCLTLQDPDRTAWATTTQLD